MTAETVPGHSAAPGREPDREQLARYVAAASPAVLRVVLYQLTGDPELARMRTVVNPTRGGSSWDVGVDERDVPRLRELALEYLSGPREVPPPPTEEQIADLVTMLVGDELSAADLRLAIDELGFDEFPRGVEWPGGARPPTADDYPVTVIGAGISGIAMAVYLDRLGIPYQVVDRQDDFGGVWRTNSYPDARVDVSSFLYQFKFHKRYPWRHWFPPRDQVLEYLGDVIDTYGLRERFEFDTEVVSAEWDEEASEWVLRLRGPGGVRTRRSRIVVSASGLFSQKSLPAIDGIEDYRGKIFHTTEWDHSYDLSRKSVGLIGNGSTGTQLMPAVARQASRFVAFQRSPNWIVEVPTYRDEIADEVGWLIQNVPYYWNWFCYWVYVGASRNQLANTVDREWQAGGGTISEKNDLLRAWLIENLERRFAHRPDLLGKLTPSYAPGAKRVIVHNGWYDALLWDHVELVTEPIVRFTAQGIVTADGREHRLDAVILASGFAVNRYFWPTEYRGRRGVTLEDLWRRDGARAYLGMAMPGFPNLFSLYGPNSQPRAGGFHPFAEAWAHYIVSGIVHLITTGGRSLECRQEVFDAYNERVDAEFADTVWATGAGGYYINKHGRPGVHVPFDNTTYYTLIRDFDPDDYRLR